MLTGYFLVTSEGPSAPRYAAVLTPYPQPTWGHWGLGRTVLSVCIESATPANPQVFVDTVNRIIEELELRTGLAWDSLRGATAVAGCPPLADFVSPARLPSKHRLHIRVRETWVPAPGVAPYVKGSAETYCMGDVCGDQTTVLTVPSLDPDVLFDAVVGGLGLYQAVLPVGWTPPWNSEPDYRATHAVQTREAEQPTR